MSFFNDTATTEIYPLSLHDALPICRYGLLLYIKSSLTGNESEFLKKYRDRKSTRLNSSHERIISYAVFCLKKKQNPSTPVHWPDQTSGYAYHDTRRDP